LSEWSSPLINVLQTKNLVASISSRRPFPSVRKLHNQRVPTKTQISIV
jgi:hypothetical protein